MRPHIFSSSSLIDFSSLLWILKSERIVIWISVGSFWSDDAGSQTQRDVYGFVCCQPFIPKLSISLWTTSSLVLKGFSIPITGEELDSIDHYGHLKIREEFIYCWKEVFKGKIRNVNCLFFKDFYLSDLNSFSIKCMQVAFIYALGKP